MAEEALVSGSLAPELIKGGERLVKSLKTAGFQLKGAFWFQPPYQALWKLFLITDQLQEVGSLRAYEKVLEFAPTKGHFYWPSLISLHTSQEPFIRTVRDAIRAAGFEGEPEELVVGISTSESAKVFVYFIW